MSLANCPNCGAPLTPNLNTCSYCGSVISDAPDMSWTRVDRQLPPADPDHPGRSVYVITLRLGDGLTFVSKKEKKTYYCSQDFSSLLTKILILKNGRMSYLVQGMKR